MDRLITISKAAKLLGVSISTLRRWEKEGKISSENRTLADIDVMILPNFSQKHLGCHLIVARQSPMRESVVVIKRKI